jgi:hypothetical protein
MKRPTALGILLSENHMCLEKLHKIVTPLTEDDAEFREWSEQSLFSDLLYKQRDGQAIILHGSSFNHGSLLLRSILVPIDDLSRACFINICAG